MKPSQAIVVLNGVMTDRGLAVGELTAQQAASLMIELYAEYRVDGIAGLDEDGDMLLFEWGSFDAGSGPSFQFGLTRQFMTTGLSDDDAITQLQLILHYDALANTNLDRGHRWCRSPQDVAVFRQFVESSPAASLVGERRASRVDLHYEQV
ncbi:MAG: hypothetical protein KJO18_08340 [Acidimicrobiia bacterium]|nr:hypothetical protein [Acidimicrobiia bacterium]